MVEGGRGGRGRERWERKGEVVEGGRGGKRGRGGRGRERWERW